MNRAVYHVSSHWFLVAMAVLWIWVGLPWLAPVFMRLGWGGLADAIYILYSLQCHQMPHRSFFLFGQKAMYALEEVQLVWPGGTNPLVLRQFVGNADMGYKVAWSDRMVSAYGGIPLAALLWWPFRDKLRPISLLKLGLFSFPMAVDGSTHFISDLAGLGLGFRYTNEWLAVLTSHALPDSFYVGNALGSFNSWMRLITGVLFAIGLVWFSFPHIRASFDRQSHQSWDKLERTRDER